MPASRERQSISSLCLLPLIRVARVSRIGLYCCAIGIKSTILPLISGAGQCLCCKSGASFPFDNAIVPEPVCAVCFLQCLPKVGFMLPAPQINIPKGAAPDSAVMSR